MRTTKNHPSPHSLGNLFVEFYLQSARESARARHQMPKQRYNSEPDLLQAAKVCKCFKYTVNAARSKDVDFNPPQTKLFSKVVCVCGAIFPRMYSQWSICCPWNVKKLNEKLDKPRDSDTSLVRDVRCCPGTYGISPLYVALPQFISSFVFCKDSTRAKDGNSDRHPAPLRYVSELMAWMDPALCIERVVCMESGRKNRQFLCAWLRFVGNCLDRKFIAYQPALFSFVADGSTAPALTPIVYSSTPSSSNRRNVSAVTPIVYSSTPSSSNRRNVTAVRGTGNVLRVQKGQNPNLWEALRPKNVKSSIDCYGVASS